MKPISDELAALVRQALVQSFQIELADPQVRASSDAKFGDYQSNLAMGLAKQLGQKPRDVAQKIVDALSAAPAFGKLCEPPEIAGPGFINVKLRAAYLADQLVGVQVATEKPEDDRLGIDRVDDAVRDTVVVDYSSPNVAKQMHVGHLRSTVIGDCLSRVLEFRGDEVIRQNHIGDWGTQFGIILEQLYDQGFLPREMSTRELVWLRADRPTSPEEFEQVYKTGNARMDDPAFAARAREAVTRLQAHDAAAHQAWLLISGDSIGTITSLYEKLGVKLRREHTRGESFYNPFLPGVVEELRAALPEGRSADHDMRAVCREDKGALCVFLEKADGSPAFKGPQGDPLPMIVQKSDGAYLYASTDLAAAAFRINDNRRQPIKFVSTALSAALNSATNGGLGGTRVLYVVGSPQKLHFEMLFATIRSLGWTSPQNAKREVRLEHVMFGSVLGEDRKMLRTRTGESVKLKDLLDEAVVRAEKLVRDSEADVEKKRGFTEVEIKQIGQTVGIAAVKYADLCQNRNTDYVFSWDKMLALQGNTAPYMLYAYARIRSIYRKALESKPFEIDVGTAPIRLEHPAERALGLRVLQFPETLEIVASNLVPNFLCDYLYDLAGRFMTFYESCPVLQAPDAATYGSRSRLCELTARALRLGLDLLGIKTLERM
jgi:arginyl-tRNA synthetase